MISADKPHPGRAIVNGKIRYTSVTQIKLFDKTVDGGCPRKWAYAYKFGIKLPRTDAQKKGSDDYAKQLEHYLTTGEDVLSPVLQPAKKFFPIPGADLECEQPLGNIMSAVELRDMLLKGKHPANIVLSLQGDIEKHAGLAFGGIPVDGAADCRHTRGEFFDADGVLQKDPPGTFVVHIDDLKSTSRIYPHKILKGPNAGQIIPTFVKTDAEVCEDPQMLGYARHGIGKYPGMTHARLSLIYANTTRREAAKRSGLISVEEIIRRTKRIDDVVLEMCHVAAHAEKIEDVEPNTQACDSFTHVDPNDPTNTLKGCGYKYQCPLHISQVVSNMISNHKESAMSLFDTLPGAAPAAPTPSAPPPPPMDPSQHRAAVDDEKQKLLASLGMAPAAPTPPAPPVAQQVAVPMPPAPPATPVQQAVSFGFCPKCGTPLSAENTSRLKDQSIFHVGCPANVAAAPPPPAPMPSLPIAVNPPDQPPPAPLVDAAVPPPPMEVASISDPALKEKLEQHAREHAAKAAAEAARIEADKMASGESVWCSGGNVKIEITTNIALEGYTCTCTKSWTPKALKKLTTKEGDKHIALLPRHKPVNKGQQQEAAPSPPAADPYAMTVQTGRTSFADATPNNPPRSGNERVPPPPPPSVPVPTTGYHDVVHPNAYGAGETNTPLQLGNTNGHANGNAHHVAVADKQAFLVELDSGVKLAVVATSMSNAMYLVEARIAHTDDGFKGINKLDGFLS